MKTPYDGYISIQFTYFYTSTHATFQIRANQKAKTMSVQVLESRLESVDLVDKISKMVHMSNMADVHKEIAINYNRKSILERAVAEHADDPFDWIRSNFPEATFHVFNWVDWVMTVIRIDETMIVYYRYEEIPGQVDTMLAEIFIKNGKFCFERFAFLQGHHSVFENPIDMHDTIGLSLISEWLGEDNIEIDHEYKSGKRWNNPIYLVEKLAPFVDEEYWEGFGDVIYVDL